MKKYKQWGHPAGTVIKSGKQERPRAKWRRGLCQTRGCQLRALKDKPFCAAHQTEREKEIARDAPDESAT